MAELMEFDAFCKKHNGSDTICVTRCETCKYHIETYGRFGYRAKCEKFTTFIPNELRYMEVERLDSCNYEEADWFKSEKVDYAVLRKEYETYTSQAYYIGPKQLVPQNLDSILGSNPDYMTLSQSRSLSGNDTISKCAACEHFRFFARTGVAKCAKFPWNINLDVFLGAIDCKEFTIWSHLKNEGYVVADSIIETRKKVLKHFKDFRGTVLKCPRDIFFDEEFMNNRASRKAR